MAELKKSPAKSGWRTPGICALLVALVAIVFGQTVQFGFLGFDDNLYIYKNPVISKGLSFSGIGWAFTHVLAGHWHPLTAILLMLECQMFGSWTGGFHLVNVLLHAACVVFLFLMLLDMTGAVWRAAFVAAIFAIHPLRAESVAWVSECKDVLSGVFFMLTLWAYVRYTRSRGRYAMVLVWFALGLMSKPMLVTVPCVLLLLDYWPLGRLKSFSAFARLLWEKIPLFVLSALSSLAAILALKFGTSPTSSYPANAPIAYTAYLGKLIYPVHLAPLYPLPARGYPVWEVLNALILLAALSAGAWFLRRRQPYLLTGWLWYLGMLVPVVGVMQTGNQAYADRYTYLPQIGLCLAGTWMAADWAGEKRYRRAILGILSGVIISLLLITGWRQAGYWRDDRTLWTHAIESTDDNFFAQNSLGSALFDHGESEEAMVHYREALRINPGYPDAHYNVGNYLLEQGRIDDAIHEYRETIRFNPAYSQAYNNLANALLRQGHVDEAVADYREAIRIDPDYEDAHYNLAGALSRQGRIDEAIAEFREALLIDPKDAQARRYLDEALSKRGR